MSTILAILFIAAATIAVIFYANGYRIGRDGVVEVTGVLTVKSNPSRSDISLNGNRDGKTTKTFSSLTGENEYTIEVEREGYHTWSKTLKIKPEKSTPLFAYLFNNEPERDSQFALEDQLLDIKSSKDFKSIFLLTVTPSEDSSESSETETVSNDGTQEVDQSAKIYRVWKFNTNQRFWDNSDNPQLIVETQIRALSDQSFMLSPGGEVALWTVETTLVETVESEDGGSKTEEKIEKKTYLIDTNSPTDSEDLEQIDLDPFYDEYQISWSNDSSYLILESGVEVLSLDIGDQSKVLLLRKSSEDGTSDVVWNTDEEGMFYHLEYSKDEEERTFSRIMQQELSGSKPEVIVKTIYSHGDNEFLSGELESLQTPFTNSPDNPRFAGTINRLDIIDHSELLVISTEFALYSYSLQDEKYILISKAPASYLETNPNSTKFIFTTEKQLGVFTFDKEEEDHTEEIGTKFILDMTEKIKDIYWHSNSEYIFYSDGESVRVVDDEGDNNFALVDLADSIFFTLSPSSEDILLLEEGKENQSIVRYTIH